MIFLNDVPYQNNSPDPLNSLKDTLAFAADDWAESRASAWVYGIVLGWGDAGAEVAKKHGWAPAQLSRLELLHERFEALIASDDTEGE